MVWFSRPQSGKVTQLPSPSRYWLELHSVEAFVSVSVKEATSQSIPVPSYLHQSPLFRVPPDFKTVASVS